MAGIQRWSTHCAGSTIPEPPACPSARSRARPSLPKGVPKFGDWEEGAQLTVVFDKVRRERESAEANPPRPGVPMVASPVQASRPVPRSTTPVFGAWDGEDETTFSSFFDRVAVEKRVVWGSPMPARIGNLGPVAAASGKLGGVLMKSSTEPDRGRTWEGANMLKAASSKGTTTGTGTSASSHSSSLIEDMGSPIWEAPTPSPEAPSAASRKASYGSPAHQFSRRTTLDAYRSPPPQPPTPTLHPFKPSALEAPMPTFHPHWAPTPPAPRATSDSYRPPTPQGHMETLDAYKVPPPQTPRDTLNAYRAPPAQAPRATFDAYCPVTPPAPRDTFDAYRPPTPLAPRDTFDAYRAPPPPAPRGTFEPYRARPSQGSSSWDTLDSYETSTPPWPHPKGALGGPPKPTPPPRKHFIAPKLGWWTEAPEEADQGSSGLFPARYSGRQDPCPDPVPASAPVVPPGPRSVRLSGSGRQDPYPDSAPGREADFRSVDCRGQGGDVSLGSGRGSLRGSRRSRHEVSLCGEESAGKEGGLLARLKEAFRPLFTCFVPQQQES